MENLNSEFLGISTNAQIDHFQLITFGQLKFIVLLPHIYSSTRSKHNKNTFF